MATNAAYREKFGIPFVVCVREHASPESILANADARLGNSREQEIETALGEIAKIARLRLEDGLSLSTHVLDTVAGRPGGGRRDRAAPATARSSRSADDRRRRAHVVRRRRAPASTSSIFAVGDYFGYAPVPGPDSGPFPIADAARSTTSRCSSRPGRTAPIEAPEQGFCPFGHEVFAQGCASAHRPAREASERVAPCRSRRPSPPDRRNGTGSVDSRGVIRRD